MRRSSIDAVHIEVAVSHQPHIHRDLTGITGLIQRSSLTASVKERAIAIFTVLAEAEAHVHNTTIEKIHFHEVGAIDSIVDIVGVSIGLDMLGIEAVYSSPVRLGRGGMITIAARADAHAGAGDAADSARLSGRIHRRPARADDPHRGGDHQGAFARDARP